MHQALVGATIVEARYTTEAEQEAMGWYEKGAILILKKKGDPDPYYIFPQADDEGIMQVRWRSDALILTSKLKKIYFL